MGPWLVLRGNFTFLSPSVYLVYEAISSVTGGIQTGSVHPAGILTLKPEDLYSVVPRWTRFKGSELEKAQLIAKGSFGLYYRPLDEFEVKPFHLADLQDPVPANAYFDAKPDCWGFLDYRQRICATITDGTYRPLIAVNPKVFAQIDPAWTKCKQPLMGNYDPPKVLQEVPSLAAPTIPAHHAPAISDLAQGGPRPADVPMAPWPAPTNKPSGIPNSGQLDATGTIMEHSGSPPSLEVTRTLKISAHTLTAVFAQSRLASIQIGESRMFPGDRVNVDGNDIILNNKGIIVSGKQLALADIGEAGEPGRGRPTDTTTPKKGKDGIITTKRTVQQNEMIGVGWTTWTLNKETNVEEYEVKGEKYDATGDKSVNDTTNVEIEETVGVVSATEAGRTRESSATKMKMKLSLHLAPLLLMVSSFHF
jgi:hypothetical protein